MEEGDDMDDIYELAEALENENNSSIIDLTSSKIKIIKNDILQQLQLNKKRFKRNA